MSDITTTPVTTASSSSSAPATVELSQDTPTAVAPQTEQAPVSASPAEPGDLTAEPATDDTPQGKRFAELMKRQRELFEREKALKEREGKLSPVQQAIEEAKRNPLKLLEAAGISYEELTEYVLSGGDEAVAPVDPVAKKLEELELKLKAQEQAEERAKQEAYEAQITKFRNDIAEAAKGYELVQALEQQDLVYDVILEHHAQSGEVLSIEQALQLTESYLEEQSKKILSVKKFQASSPVAEPVMQAARPMSQKPAVPKTLSQAALPPPATSASEPKGEKLTREQLMERAIQSLRFK